MLRSYTTCWQFFFVFFDANVAATQVVDVEWMDKYYNYQKLTAFSFQIFRMPISLHHLQKECFRVQIPERTTLIFLHDSLSLLLSSFSVGIYNYYSHIQRRKHVYHRYENFTLALLNQGWQIPPLHVYDFPTTQAAIKKLQQYLVGRVFFKTQFLPYYYRFLHKNLDLTTTTIYLTKTMKMKQATESEK